MKKENELSRSLTQRHIQMIAIGGAIGTGLFLGSGSAIQSAGPSIIIGYLLAGIFCFFMMRAIGELLLSDTNLTSFILFVRKYLGKRAEFVIGWTYWLCWESLAMADLTASGVYLHYWFPQLPQWVSALVIIIVLVVFNLLSVGLFGELESWFSSIKVMAILALIVTGIILLFSHATVGGQTVSVTNLFNHGGFFPKGVNGFMLALPMVIFAFTGIELVGLASGETKNPKRDLPRAINTLPLRIGLFYIGAMFVLMCIYPWNDVVTDSSPFVQVFAGIGIKSAAAVINFVVLTAALSACNSAIFSTSRTLFVLAQSKQAPKRYANTSDKAVPVSSLLFSSVILFVIVGLNYVLPATVFDIISGVSTLSFIIVWVCLVYVHYLYRKQQAGVDEFKMPLYPVSNWLTIIFFILVIALSAAGITYRISLIFTVIWFAALAGLYPLFARRYDSDYLK